MTSVCTAPQALIAARFERGEQVSPVQPVSTPTVVSARAALGGGTQAGLTAVALLAFVALLASKLQLVVVDLLVVVVGLIGLIRVVIPTTGCGPPS